MRVTTQNDIFTLIGANAAIGALLAKIISDNAEIAKVSDDIMSKPEMHIAGQEIAASTRIAIQYAGISKESETTRKHTMAIVMGKTPEPNRYVKRKWRSDVMDKD